MRPLVGVLAGAIAAGVIACSASHGGSAAPPPTTAGAMSPMPPGTHDQIAKLDREIEEERAKLQLPEPPMTPNGEVAPMATHPAEACHAGQSDTCQDVCKLNDTICENADKICELAKQMPGDAWADNKCKGAKVSCGQAHERCCSCSV